MNIIKKCSICNKDKELSNFYKQAKGKFGVKSSCKDCEKKERETKYWENPQKKIQQVKQYQKTHSKSNKPTDN